MLAHLLDTVSYLELCHGMSDQNRPSPGVLRIATVPKTPQMDREDESDNAYSPEDPSLCIAHVIWYIF